MPFRVYNTLSRTQEEFIPLVGRTVRMYTCGPTVYDYAHIGNYRAYIFEDLLRRFLKYLDYEVTQVMNLTDVDDKTIRGAIENNISLDAYTRPYKEAFFADLKTLHIEPAEFYPAATDHIDEMIELIRRLLDTGYAYRSEDGAVYFSIERFPEYGKLAHLDRAGLRPGARVAQDEYDKENASDFALWKAWDPSDGDVAWDAPWGRGRPGWHIECSAMSMKYLGHSFDIHTGGVDNIFPHHEDEIAQSEAATGESYASYWLHCAHLVVEGRKMSKSLGNFHTLRDIMQKGYSGREIRYVLIATHYRQSLNFCMDALQAARAALERIDEFRRRVREHTRGGYGRDSEWLDLIRSQFIEALNDDLNVSRALAALFELLHEGNKRIDARVLDPDQADAIERTLNDFDRVLGVLEPEEHIVDEHIRQLVEQREQARRNKDWAASDRLRDEIARQGWMVQDTPEGPQMKKLHHQGTSAT